MRKPLRFVLMLYRLILVFRIQDIACSRAKTSLLVLNTMVLIVLHIWIPHGICFSTIWFVVPMMSLLAFVFLIVTVVK